MQSLRYLYRIGKGPSSSHTIGPHRAIEFLLNKYKNIKEAEVTLYDSLAFTGRGHLTDKVIIDTFAPIPCKMNYDYKTPVDFPNTFDVKMTLTDGTILNRRVLSLGGGRISISDEISEEYEEIYPEKNLTEILDFCKKNNMRIPDYVELREGKEIWDYLYEVWMQMLKTIDKGLSTKGVLQGRLKIKRKAANFLFPSHANESVSARSYRLLSGYAFATGEENADGGIVVTAPTCGSSGTLPAVMKYISEFYNHSVEDSLRALATAGVIGNIIKQNGSISGAEAGCQAEIGSACAMAAAAFSELRLQTLDQIESAAEIAIEHSLGLTCDPVGGYVQIPCIERNAIAAVKAVSACYLSDFVTESHTISFDTAVRTMLQTGRDINRAYRETATGGLAASYETKE